MRDIIPEFQGKIVTSVSSAPAAGVETSLTMPARVRWRVKTVSFSLTTSGGAGNRVPHLRIRQDGITVWRSNPANLQTSTQTVEYRFGSGLGVDRAVVTEYDQQSFPVDMLLNKEAIIDTAASALLGGDQFTGITVLVEEWQEPIV